MNFRGITPPYTDPRTKLVAAFWRAKDLFSAEDFCFVRPVMRTPLALLDYQTDFV